VFYTLQRKLLVWGSNPFVALFKNTEERPHGVAIAVNKARWAAAIAPFHRRPDIEEIRDGTFPHRTHPRILAGIIGGRRRNVGRKERWFEILPAGATNNIIHGKPAGGTAGGRPMRELLDIVDS